MTSAQSPTPWFEARSASKGALLVLLLCNAAISEDAKPASPHYAEHHDLSYYLFDDGTRAPIRTPADWEKRRAHIIAGMLQVMGPLPHPKKPVALNVQMLEQYREQDYTRWKIAYHTDDLNKRTHAWLLIPASAGRGVVTGDALKTVKKHPAILCLHQTTPNGKDSPVGLSDRATLHYAKELAKRGYVTISPDYPSFGESKDYDFDADNYISGSMKAIYDNTRAIDLLQSLPEVDGERIGCIGHSLGGHNTLFTAVFDPRIKAAVTCCGFTSFHKYKGGDLKGWTSTRYMPLITTKYKNSPDKMPFDFHEVIAAIAPRAVFVVAPLHDDNFDIEGVRDVLNAVRPIYKLLDATERLQSVHPDIAHEFPDGERKQAYEFLDQTLKRVH